MTTRLPHSTKGALPSADHGASARPVGVRRPELLAIGVAIVWLIGTGGMLLFGRPASEGGTLSTLMTLLAVFLPVALVWVAVTSARTAREMRAEAARLHAAIDALRSAHATPGPELTTAELSPAIERKLEQLVAAQHRPDPVAPSFSSRRDHAQVVPSADHKTALALTPQSATPEAQPLLALGTPAEDLRAPVSNADFLRALNFPESAEDKSGFRALRLALEDPRPARLIRAAQDVLTLLSEDGIYMDDLKPDRARPELWRRFAQGARGGEISGLGGVRDRSCLALTAGRMREDTVFRDAAHHFLRQFDQMLEEFEPRATDQELGQLADTRTARAFMLLGRVTGIFE